MSSEIGRRHLPVDCWCGQSWDLRPPDDFELAQGVELTPERPGLPRIPFALRGKVTAVWNGEHYEFEMLHDLDDIICTNCGNDLATEGQAWCTECLENWRVCSMCQTHLATDDTDWCATCLERDPS